MISEVKDWTRSGAGLAAVDAVVAAVAKACGLSASDLLGDSRRKSVAWARHAAMFLARERSNLSYPEIGALFHRDHTTVLAATRKIGAALADDEELNRLLSRVRSEIVLPPTPPPAEPDRFQTVEDGLGLVASRLRGALQAVDALCVHLRRLRGADGQAATDEPQTNSGSA